MSTAQRLAALERRFARRKPGGYPPCVVSPIGMTAEAYAAELARVRAERDAWQRRTGKRPAMLIEIDA
jgi:hypothetical protein